MSAMDDLELQFSPSLWCKRFSNSNEAIENHLNLTARETELNKTKYNCKLNISYGETEREKYDIFYKNEEIGKPIFVFIHGGYWQLLNKNIYSYFFSPLIEQGYRVIIVGYNLCPTLTLNELVNEIEKAIVKIFHYANETMTNHISFCGHSAGAHLVAATLLNQSIKHKLFQPQLLKNIYLLSGLYDLTKLWQTKEANANNILQLDTENAIKLSPFYLDLNLLKNYYDHLKIYIMVGENDSPEYINKQSLNFHKKLLKSEFKSEMKIFINYDHFNIVEHLISNDSEITKYIFDKENIK